MMNVEQQVLERVLPSQEEERKLQEIISGALSELKKNIKTLGIKAEPMLVGSVAKGTHLKNPEIDIFVLFPPQTQREELEKYGLELGLFLKNKKKMYAEHPYTRGVYRGYETEVVPCYSVASPDQKLSAVDRTPYHTKYVLEKLGPGQRDQVRLLKAFMKGIGIYGAEAKIQGFSGYLCELLVLKYGSFRDVLNTVERWQAGNIIALDTLPTKVFDEPLIVVDPVDGGRNVASAVSREKMGIFIHAASEYLKKPKVNFFFPNSRPRVTREKIHRILKNRGTHLLLLTIKAPKVTDDILYPQIRKALRAFEDLFTRNGFSVMGSSFNLIGDEILFLFEFDIFYLPSVKKHEGPPVWVKNSIDFQNKWDNSKDTFSRPYIENGLWFVDTKREETSASKLVSVRYKELSLGKDLDRSAKKTLKCLIDDKALKRGYLDTISRLLIRTFHWET